jgi:hypothetical protein
MRMYIYVSFCSIIKYLLVESGIEDNKNLGVIGYKK